MKKSKKSIIFPLLVLLIFLISGLVLIRDYGASADEHIQIETGHMLWKYLCLKFHREVPSAIANVPELYGSQNGFYGQAATFPMLLLEALKGFSLDISTVVRLRHYWNFFTCFAALCCFSAAAAHIHSDYRTGAVWLLLQILLPRIFGDIFYNDRDIMLMSWMMIFLAAFYLFTQRPGPLTALLSAFCFAVAVNTRIFGLVLLIFPFLYFLFSENRKYLLMMVPAAILFWFVLSPFAWEDPLHALPDAVRHFSTQQRAKDTNNEAELLFFGNLYNETRLPWYYLPMYIVVSTPLMTLAAGALGAVSGGRAAIRLFLRKKPDIREVITLGMLVILIAVPLIGIIFHLTYYNGWRHFYFLCLPITWLALEGIRCILRSKFRLLQWAAAAALCVSFGLSAVWIVKAHPYQSIYLSPVFRKRWIGKMDRDYWILSTTELMKYLLDNAPESALNVVDKYTFIEYTNIGLPPQERERFRAMYHSAQPIPYDYLFFNYSGEAENEKKFDYYESIYTVERDGISLAEIYKRSHNNEMNGAEIVETVMADFDPEGAFAAADNDYGTAWHGSKAGDLRIKFNRSVLLDSIEVFPAEGTAGFHDVKVSVSDDGKTWHILECEPKGSNGTAFPQTETRWLRLQSSTENQGIREILFYGR